MLRTKVQVKEAGYKYIGHYRTGGPFIELENHAIGLSFSVGKFELLDLFNVFGVDCENGAYLNELQGRVCLVEIDDHGNATKLVSVTNDKFTYSLKPNS